MSYRNTMIDNEELFTGELYSRSVVTKKIDIENDYAQKFKFAYYNSEGKISEDAFVVPNRRVTAESIKIKTSSNKTFKPDDIVKIDGSNYNITNIATIHNSSYDLTALRRGRVAQITRVIVLDK